MCYNKQCITFIRLCAGPQSAGPAPAAGSKGECRLQLLPIADSIDGLFIQNSRFSTTHISVNLYLPLQQSTLAANALLPFVLTSCCAAYPDFGALNLRLCELYGAEIGAAAEKVGDRQLLRLFSFSLDNSQTPDQSRVIEQAAGLLQQMLFEPALNGNAFCEADVARERRLTLEKIEGLANDKRAYAIAETLRHMYPGDPFGEYKTGSANAVSAITPEQLFAAWQAVLAGARVRIQVVGATLPSGLFERFAKGFAGVNRRVQPLPKTVAKVPNQTPARFTQKMAVTQGKLVLGFAANRLLPASRFAAISVFSDLFGGGPYSALFTQVREKLSLCYYCAARANRTKGYLLVDSGVEPQNAARAEEEICRQLSQIQQGNFSAEVLAASKRSLRDSIACFEDSEASLDSWYSLLSEEQLVSPAEYAAQIGAVEQSQVVEAANTYSLDTVFAIQPEKEGAQ